jgi:tRNA threonylcarbamoyl adenosine modification protein YeaZ/ribosomal-protein-alanine acetyltransferase
VNNAEYNIAVVVILGLETATRQGSVALFDEGRVHAAAGDPARSHGQRLPGELLEFLHQHGRRLAEVDLFAVIGGPGSFTGLRVGMATIQGLALTLGRPVAAIPTLEAIAAAWRRDAPADPRVVAPCLDGQRGEVFFASYDRHQILPPQVGSPEDAGQALAAEHSGRAVVLVGDGAERYRDRLAVALPEAEMAPWPGTLADAAVRVAALQPARAGAPHALRPIYIRRPDAEVARDRRRPAPPPAPAGPPLPPGVTIHQARDPAEIAAVEALQRESFTNAWGVEAIRWELENTDVARLYVMRTAEGEVIAYCACWLIFDELHINSLAVADLRRRQGLAEALLRAVMHDARGSGAQAATLEVRRSNEPALRLYEKLGFRVEAVRRDYYQSPREDALVLWHRHLAGHSR